VHTLLCNIISYVCCNWLAARFARIIRLAGGVPCDLLTFYENRALCAGGDLQSYLQERHHRQLPEREARTIISQVFDGLVYLNSNHELRDTSGNKSMQKVIHYDLKPANILFDDLGMVKISDFGLSKLLSAESGRSSLELTSPGAGTLYYQPPECQMVGPGGQAPMISNKVDVWAAGMGFLVCSSCCCGHILYVYVYMLNTSVENIWQPQAIALLVNEFTGHPTDCWTGSRTGSPLSFVLQLYLHAIGKLMTTNASYPTCQARRYPAHRPIVGWFDKSTTAACEQYTRSEHQAQNVKRGHPPA
jgi:serine/threonine protein kinase